MKAYILLLSFVLLSAVSFGQENRFGFTFSPVFGFANVEANQSADDGVYYTDDTSGRTGFAYGAIVDFGFSDNDRYFIFSGVTVHHTGFEIVNTNAGGGTTTSRVKADYVEIPLALKLKSNPIGYLTYYGQFGLKNAFKVGEKIKDGVDTEWNDLNTFNIGMNIGGGIEYDISGQTTATGGLHYINGLSSVAETSAGKIKNNQLMLGLGVYF